jgi:hypothetical protein
MKHILEAWYFSWISFKLTICGERHYLVFITRINAATECVLNCERSRRKIRRAQCEEEMRITVNSQSSAESCKKEPCSSTPVSH